MKTTQRPLTFSPEKKMLIYGASTRTAHNSSVFVHRLISMKAVVYMYYVYSYACCEQRVVARTVPPSIHTHSRPILVVFVGAEPNAHII